MKPPAKIDGADVLEYAWSDEAFGVVRYTNGEVASSIHGLAICRYHGSDAVYRFSCNQKWETVQDSDHESISEAKAQLPAQYQNSPVRWQKLSCY